MMDYADSAPNRSDCECMASSLDRPRRVGRDLRSVRGDLRPRRRLDRFPPGCMHHQVDGDGLGPGGIGQHQRRGGRELTPCSRRSRRPSGRAARAREGRVRRYRCHALRRGQLGLAPAGIAGEAVSRAARPARQYPRRRPPRCNRGPTVLEIRDAVMDAADSGARAHHLEEVGAPLISVLTWWCAVTRPS